MGTDLKGKAGAWLANLITYTSRIGVAVSRAADGGADWLARGVAPRLRLGQPLAVRHTESDAVAVRRG